MSVPLDGGCACGAVGYHLKSDPLFIHCCHCLNCQRQTGSAFVINVLIEADRVELLAGDPQELAARVLDHLVVRARGTGDEAQLTAFHRVESKGAVVVGKGLLVAGLLITATLHGLYDSFSESILGVALAVLSMLLFVAYYRSGQTLQAKISALLINRS